jgi:flagellar basal-body rod modification protein FlgD
MSTQIDAMTLGASSGLLATTSAAGSVGLDGTQIKKAGDTSDVFGLGRDDFFKLFLAQLKNQDPTKPVDDKEFIAQLAQFTMIDTLQSLDKTMAGTQLAEASGLIGKQVTGTAVDGTAVTGAVQEVIQDEDGLALVVVGKAVRPAAVTLVTAADTTPLSNA